MPTGKGMVLALPWKKILRAPITDPRMTCVTSEYYLLSACLYDNVAQIHYIHVKTEIKKKCSTGYRITVSFRPKSLAIKPR